MGQELENSHNEMLSNMMGKSNKRSIGKKRKQIIERQNKLMSEYGKGNIPLELYQCTIGNRVSEKCIIESDDVDDNNGEFVEIDNCFQEDINNEDGVRCISLGLTANFNNDLQFNTQIVEEANSNNPKKQRRNLHARQKPLPNSRKSYSLQHEHLTNNRHDDSLFGENLRNHRENLETDTSYLHIVSAVAGAAILASCSGGNNYL